MPLTHLFLCDNITKLCMTVGPPESFRGSIQNRSIPTGSSKTIFFCKISFLFYSLDDFDEMCNTSV